MREFNLTPERLREIAEHVFSLGSYTQAEELHALADDLEQLMKEGKK